MAEKRFYKMTGKNANGRNVEAYYAGHGLDKIRLDAAKDAGAFPSDISHKTMKATEFYDDLDRTEASKRVKSSKVKGIGRKWVVEEESEEEERLRRLGGNGLHPSEIKAFDEDMQESYGNEDKITVNEKGEYVDENGAPLNPMLDENLLKAFEDAGYPHIPNQIEDDRIGLPDDSDDYEPDDEELMKHYRRMEAQLNDPPVYGDPCNEPPDDLHVAESYPDSPYYDKNDIIVLESSLGKMHPRGLYYDLQDDYITSQLESDENTGGPMHTIGGYPIAPDEKEDKYDTGKLEIPTEEQQKAELEKLRKDPNTYPYSKEEILDEDILSTSSNIPTRGTQQTYV